MLETIEQWDRQLFLFLNGLHSDFMDPVMWHISGKYEWIPLYALLLFFLIRKNGKSTWMIILGAVLTIVLADQVSVKLFKEVVERYRPCHNGEITDLIHTVNNKCGGKFGFVSSHATNSFAIATFMGLFLSAKESRHSFIILLLWAFIISYSRIYLGVHYPLDIIGGAILGCAIAFLVYRITLAFVMKYYSND